MQASPAATPQRVVLTVSQLNREVRELLDGGLPLLWVEGEISNLARPASGHVYFSLKDDRAQVRCAMFRPRVGLLRFRPDNGQQVLVRARVGLYEPRGDYQLIVESMEEAGDGALRRQFEELRARLEAEGLFAADRKRPLPTLPRRIGVVTSASGAVIRDILQVLRRRFPAIRVLLYPVPVQGREAASAIIRMLNLAETRNEVDALIVARGGGSLEDLQPFNEESVARAIADCRLPVVSAVGHETDVTIADLVADQRAPTPSAAAELLSPDGADWLTAFNTARQRLARLQRERLRLLGQGLANLHGRLGRQHPGRRLREHAQRLDELDGRLRRAVRQTLNRAGERTLAARRRLLLRNPARRITADLEHNRSLQRRLLAAQRGILSGQRQRLAAITRNLETVSPLATVARGYAILQRKDGVVVRDAAQVRKGDILRARLARGTLVCRVNESDTESS